jgi:glycosyltransferase involved in cell wall biosynthesis
LFLGSWIERKGTVELAAAWRRVAAAHPGARLTIAGAGNGDGARADLRGVDGVEVIDAIDRDELPGLLASHDLFVLPSWFEGLPLSMLEAAAGGLACVVSGICGMLDVFRAEDPEADGARLVTPSGAEALYRVLEPLVADAEARRALGDRARSRARCFTWARTAEQSIAAYAAAIERRTGVAGAAPTAAR